MRFAVLAAVLLAGCATQVKVTPVSGPTGKPAFAMRCGGSSQGLASCYEAAGRSCPGGYSVVDRATSTSVVSVNGVTAPSVQQTLVIECR